MHSLPADRDILRPIGRTREARKHHQNFADKLEIRVRQHGAKSDTGPFRRILVATDFSTDARMALRRVSFLPLADSCVITVVHVAPKATTFVDSKQISDFAKERLAQEVEDLRAKLHGHPQVTVTSNLIHDANPVDPILKLANFNKSELIVMGRYGTSGFKDLLIGSVAERVVIRASSPVLVVGKMRPTPYTNAMGAIDDDAVALEVPRFLIRISPEAKKHAILHDSVLMAAPIIWLAVSIFGGKT